MELRKRLGVLSFVVALAGLYAGPAAADVVLSFDAVSANSVDDVTTGEAQFSVTVSPGPSSNQVSFTFNNTGLLASSITDVYFDDGTLLGIATITDGAGVDFEQGASPPNLPSGNNASPPFVATFTADSKPPAQPNGVNPGEFVTIVFNLQSGLDFDDVVAALNLGGATGGLRIGIHVQGFDRGGSESFGNNPPNNGGGGQQLPEPGGLALLGLALAGLALARRRRA